MFFGDMIDGLFGNVENERRAAARRLQREREEAAERDRAARDRHSAQMREQQAETDRARREVDRVAREKRETEQRLIKEQKAMEASMLREYNAKMQEAYNENMDDMRRASAEKDALNREHRKREMEIIRMNEEKHERVNREAAERLDKLNADYSKNIEEKNREAIQTKETMHNEKITLMQKNEQEKIELQKEHLESLSETQEKFLEQQKLMQEKFENETTALRTDANRREQLLKEEKARAGMDFQRQMKEQESMTKEERLATQKRHEGYIKSKDAAIDKLRNETESRVEELHEANRLQQERDLATLKEIGNERIDREKEVHAQIMEIGQKNQEHSAFLYEMMIQEKDKSHARLFLEKKQRHDDTHQYQQILTALPRALASEQQTSQLMLLKTKLYEMASNTDEAFTQLELAFDDFKKKETPKTFGALEISASELNECIKVLNRTVDSCNSVIATTRNEWRELLRQLQKLTSPLTRTSAKMLGLTKRKAVTLEVIDGLTAEFDRVKNAIYDLPNLNEGSVMEMVEQRQGAIVQSNQESTNLNRLKDVYDQLFQKEKGHQATCLEYDQKITQMQDDLYSRILEEKERSTQLTEAFMAQHQQMIEGMYALMSRMQRAVLSDRDCMSLSDLQATIFKLGNDQLDVFNEFSVLTTNNKKTREHVKRKAKAKKLDELCQEIRTNVCSLERSLARNTSIDSNIKVELQRSTAHIELAIQSFLKVFRQLRLVLNRGEDMHDRHVDSITMAFDRMQEEIVAMPPLSSASALEVIESGLQQLAIEDSRGQQAIANGSTSMIGWYSFSKHATMGFGDMIGGLFGAAEEERREAQKALDRARYEALQKQAALEKEAAERAADLEREHREQLEEANANKAAAEARAHEEKMRLEREKADVAREASEALLKMTMANHEQQRATEREAARHRSEIEKEAREADLRFREETELKREKDRIEAKAREDKKQKEATDAINEANKSVMEMKDKTHADMTRLVVENQQSKDELMKENLKIIQAKDAANAEKLERLNAEFFSQKKEAEELAKQREDALHLERKAVDEQYRKDMENMSKMSKEERDKMTSAYRKIVEEKEKELSKNQREKDAKVDELNKNHLADLRKAHEEYNKLQETSKTEFARLQKEKEDILRESAAKQEKSAMENLALSERKNGEVLALTNQAVLAEAVKMKASIRLNYHIAEREYTEFLRITKADKELEPIKDIRCDLVNNATDSQDLWSQLEYSTEDLNKIKDKIIDKSKLIKRNINDLLITIDKCGSIGEQKMMWKAEVLKLNGEATKYAKDVIREFKVETTTLERFRQLEDACESLVNSIHNLPDMTAESVESLINRSARDAIACAENRGATRPIAAPVKKDDKGEKQINGNDESGPLVDE